MVARQASDRGELNIGIIGCGGVMESYHLPVIASIPDVKIRWMCDASVERARVIAKSWGVKEAYGQIDECPDVDAVMVATPVGTRKAILEKTSAKGWHTFCEKPFASSTSEHREMLEIAARGGIKIGAAYVRRFLWAVGQAHELLQSKALGNLKEVVGSEYVHLERTGVGMSSYRNNVKIAGGGVLLETGSHLVDEIFFMTDATAVDLQSCSQKNWNDQEVETFASACLTLPAGGHAMLKLGVSGIRPLFSGVSFRCELGEIRVHLARAKGLEIFHGPGQRCRVEIPSPRPNETDVTMAFRKEWVHFLDALRSPGKWDPEFETGVLTTDFIMRCGEISKNSLVEVQP